MREERRPPYPRTTPPHGGHYCPRCGAWSPDPWHMRKIHHCPNDDNRKEDE